MIILFLDDDEYRYKKFKHEKIGYIIEWVQTAQQCIEALEKHASKYSEIWLDHDLGGETYVDSSLDNTGAGVVRWVQQHQPETDAIWYVHSLNPVGALNMCQDLLQTGYRVKRLPFTQLGK